MKPKEQTYWFKLNNLITHIASILYMNNWFLLDFSFFPVYSNQFSNICFNLKLYNKIFNDLERGFLRLIHNSRLVKMWEVCSMLFMN